MQRILEGLRIVEGSAFIAAPLCGTTLAQLGADVIRFDQLGGGLDYKRWPVTKNNTSIYWAEMNKGKRSICVNLKSEAGQEIIKGLITATGDNNGIFSTNLPAKGWLSYESLSKLRTDLIQHEIIGDRHGRTALDYTVNAKVGFPYLTGQEKTSEPVNHILPAWDIATAYNAAVNILAAERQRRLTGKGQQIKLALADVALATVSNLGLIGEVKINGEKRRKIGNFLYGAFGKDFLTRDKQRIMVIAVSPKQWFGLLKITQLEEKAKQIEKDTGLNFNKEGDRYHARKELFAIFAPWVAERNLAEVSALFDEVGVCWDKYQSITELVENDPDCSAQNPIFSETEQTGIGTYPVSGGASQFMGQKRESAKPGPTLGQHTNQILSEVLNLDEHNIQKLHRDGIVA